MELQAETLVLLAPVAVGQAHSMALEVLIPPTADTVEVVSDPLPQVTAVGATGPVAVGALVGAEALEVPPSQTLAEPGWVDTAG